MENAGLFIVLEGSDGSGKTTQFKLLAERLRAVGHDVAVFDFPRYDEPSSYFVKRYLNGDYGPASEVSPYTASLFYALDRFEAAPAIKQALAAGQIVLSNRYVGSNMAHQGSKFGTPAEQRGFFLWEESLEYQLLDIPRPAINIFLRVPAETAFKLIGQKSARTYTVSSRDEHEKDIEHLQKTVQTYDLLCQLFTKDFKAIECAPGGTLLKVTEISDLIWQAIKPLLPPPVHKGKKRVVHLESPAGQSAVKERGSEQGPAVPKARQGEVLKFDVKSVSLLAVSEIMTNDGISVSFSPAWPKGKNFTAADIYTPQQLSKKELKVYRNSTQKIAKLYVQLQARLKERSFAQLITPLALLTDIEIRGSAVAVQNLLERLTNSDLGEARQLGDRLQQSLKRWLVVKSPAAAKSAPDKKRRQLIRELVESQLPHGVLREDETLRLLEAWPRNEFELLADSLYPLSDLARSDIVAALDKMTYTQKQEALISALEQDASQLLSKVHYRFDVLADMASMLKIYGSGIATSLQLQRPTVRYGFKIPDQLEESEFEELFGQAFDESFNLYSLLQPDKSAGSESYAVLLGHKQRWQFNTTAAAISGYWQSKSLAKNAALNAAMAQKVAENHPQISAFISQPKPPLAAVTAKKPPAPKKTKASPRRRRSRSKRK